MSKETLIFKFFTNQHKIIQIFSGILDSYLMQTGTTLPAGIWPAEHDGIRRHLWFWGGAILHTNKDLSTPSLQQSLKKIRGPLINARFFSRQILEVPTADEFYSVMGDLTREMLVQGLMDANQLVQVTLNLRKIWGKWGREFGCVLQK